MAPTGAMRPITSDIGATSSINMVTASLGAASNSNGSRIPVPPKSAKREAGEPLVSIQVRESPSLQRLHRLACLDSPAKFRKPVLPGDREEGSPASGASYAVRSLSLAPNCRSPLATPPGRRKSGIGANTMGVSTSTSANRSLTNKRLSMYGVPLSMVGGGGGAGHIARSSESASGPVTFRDKRIVVCVRKRPLSAVEVRGGDDCISVNENGDTVGIAVLRTKLDGLNKYHEEYSFSFDRAYAEVASNEQIYEDIVEPLVRFCVRGGRATCFAYGQTGSGKTHTMFHPQDGQCYLAMMDLLRRRERGVELWISFFEIYQGQLYDLLRGRKRVIPCERKDGQVAIMGLEEDIVTDEATAREVIQRGLAARMTGRTGANAQSSRSHAILQFTLRPRGPDATSGGALSVAGGGSYRPQAPSSPPPIPSPSDIIYGRISFIDLAGSERGADRAEADRRTKLEGSEINKSLLALKECIRALDLDAAHLPFRQSKLTLVLKDSIIGDVRTAMIATVSPATSSSEHSLNTLRYAERFHEISTSTSTSQQQRRIRNSPSGGLVTQQGSNSPPGRGEDWLVSPLKRDDLTVRTPYTGATQLSDPISTSTPLPPLLRSSPHRGRLLVTPVKTVTFAMPATALEERKQRIDSLLASLRTQVQTCQDDDVLEVLQEELANIGHAFRSLA